MNCPKCQAPISGFAKYCPHCGEKLPQKAISERRRFGLGVVLGLIVLAGLIWALTRWSVESPEGIVRDQLKAIKNNQLTEAYYAYTSKEFQAVTSLDDFKKFIKMFPLLSENAEAKLDVLKDQNNLKVMKGTFKGSAGESLSVNYQLMKQDNHWKILNMKAIPGSPEEMDVLRSAHLEILKPIEDQLKVLDAGNLKDAYEVYTSKTFKDSTSFDAFKLFLTHFPILTTFTDFQIMDISAGKASALVKFKFINPELHSEVEYTMTKDNGKWLVRGIQIVSQENPPNVVPDFNLEEVLKPLQEQMKAIRAGELKKAYDDFTSEAFRQATSFEEFEAFIKRFDIFNDNRSADFYKLSFNNNVGIYNARLTSKKGEEREVEYALIKEKGVWKILQIQVINPTE